MTESEVSAAELNVFREQYGVSYSIGDFTPTVCAISGMRMPKQCGGVPSKNVLESALKELNGGKVEKMLLFCPDAIGDVQCRRFPELFAGVEKLSDVFLPGVSVMQCVTPVCYATIFSGASPSVHGIRTYEKPVLKIETLFDILAEAEKNVAIAAMNDCSIDMIFRGRAVDYYSLRTDDSIFRTSMKLLSESDYDVIISYMSDYDHFGHHTDVFSEKSVEQLHLAVERFEAFCGEADRVWGNSNRLVAFVPDHGQHTVHDHRGTHGTHHDNIPEDMLVNHYYRIRRGCPLKAEPGTGRRISS